MIVISKRRNLFGIDISRLIKILNHFEPTLLCLLSSFIFQIIDLAWVATPSRLPINGDLADIITFYFTTRLIYIVS